MSAERDMADGLAFLAGLRANNQSGVASFGSVTVGRTTGWSPPQQLPKVRRSPVVINEGDDLLKYMR